MGSGGWIGCGEGGVMNFQGGFEKREGKVKQKRDGGGRFIRHPLHLQGEG